MVKRAMLKRKIAVLHSRECSYLGGKHGGRNAHADARGALHDQVRTEKALVVLAAHEAGRGAVA